MFLMKKLIPFLVAWVQGALLIDDPVSSFEVYESNLVTTGYYIQCNTLFILCLFWCENSSA